ncbi:MAG: carboxypeptidase M32 [Candidatus Thermoplasmatota archaeon]|nr:carboxypeptidase M32 [Candidatus Thermoplasmatota archaeon]
MSIRIYSNFIELVKELYDLKKISDLLDWDEKTYMPTGAVKDRACESSTLSAVLHEKLISKAMGRYLRELNKGKVKEKLTRKQKAIVREIARLYERETKIPIKLVKEIARVKSLATEAWVRAKKNADFNIFKSLLEKMINLKKEVAESIGYEDKPYDALLDEYEPYTKVKDISPVFSELRKPIVSVVKSIKESGCKIDDRILTQKFDLEKQKEFGLQIIKDMGFNLERGRLDVSAHPFTAGSYRDVRLTTRYKENDLRTSLFAMIHEAGHGLYEQGYREEHYRTPLADFISLGYHESQSRLWENMVGRSLSFWKYYYPKLQELFSVQLKNYSLEDFYKAINVVRPSFIRVEADEVTYNLHILLRYELEIDIFDDKVSAKELPQLWNEKMEDYLGIVPENDAVGVLQDVHWSQGYFGYFPTYSLGNLYAAQLLNAAKKTIPDFEIAISEGKLSVLKQWLNCNVHQYGKLYSAKELTKKVTGEMLNPNYFLEYIKTKFGPLYGIEL